MSERYSRVFGIDFSGAKDAGDRIWIAGGSVADRAVRIESCYPARDLPGSGKKRDRCLKALRTLIAGSGRALFGLDFPFGLPQELTSCNKWEAFVLAFPSEHPNPEAFRQACREAAPGRELKRQTDRETKAPFSPYNIRLYRQTYYGISRLLSPLVGTHQASALPMQPPEQGSPLVLEICPASTLKKENLYVPYKGNSEDRRRARQRILETLEGQIRIRNEEIRLTVINDTGGDALDSIIAAMATYRAQHDPAFPKLEGLDNRGSYAVEGYIYV
jgi:hypothetical protein